MRCTILLALVAMVVPICAADAQDGARAAHEPNALDATAVVRLLCDSDARSELKLAASQKRSMDSAFQQVAPRLWLVRDASTPKSQAELAELAAGFVQQSETLLEPAQRTRLRQLLVQARGWPGILQAELAEQLTLSADQRSRIEAILTQTQESLKQAAAAESAAAREAASLEARRKEGTSIQELLSAKQRTKLAELVGTPYDLSSIRPLTYPAPEIKEVEGWLNSQPLTLAACQGRVVAFHFWAFGCINCVRNLPHYAAWHKDFASSGLVVLGMHTPETQTERSFAALKDKVSERGIEYPVAMDRENQNWAAWANSMWPSVYLVDKQGRIRYWWYGELNWQGAEGERFLREKISELLAEETAR